MSRSIQPRLRAVAGALALALPAAAVAQAPDSVTLFGEIRTRAEADRPGSGARGDAFTLLRTRLGVRARVGGNARVLAELQDSRAFGEERSTADGSADALDLHQGWLELSGRWGVSELALRAGRQEIAFGNERLIGAVGWTNTGRSFDGVRVDVARSEAPDAWSATAFAATVQERGRRYGTRPDGVESAPDHALGGIFATDGRMEALVVHDRAARFRTFEDADRTTAYARYRTPAFGGVHLDLEGAYQLGDQRRLGAGDATGPGAMEQDVRAWMAGARVIRDGSGRVPTLILGLDWLSGDDDPTDDSYTAFNTLYGTNHKWYGFMDLFLDPAANTRDHGLVDLMAGAALPLSERSALRADLHGFWTAAYPGPTTTSPAAGANHALGWELDLTLPVKVNATSGLELGYALFGPGPAGEVLGLGARGKSRHWGYVQLRVGF